MQLMSLNYTLKIAKTVKFMYFIKNVKNNFLIKSQPKKYTSTSIPEERCQTVNDSLEVGENFTL